MKQLVVGLLFIGTLILVVSGGHPRSPEIVPHPYVTFYTNVSRVITGQIFQATCDLSLIAKDFNANNYSIKFLEGKNVLATVVVKGILSFFLF